VLYPWHHELDNEFKKLKAEHKDLLHHYHEVKLQRLEALERRMGSQEMATKVSESGRLGYVDSNFEVGVES